MADIDITQYPDTVAFFDGDAKRRATVFLDRYAKKGPDGQPVERLPVEMWFRVAEAISGSDPEMYLFQSLLEDFKFVPGGRILSGAGTGTEVTFYNCYVIPVETEARRKFRSKTGQPGHHAMTPEDTGNDSREAIIDTIGVMVDIMSRGGGVGVNWSVLRPAGAHLKRINATSSGPVDWMDLASKAVGTVEQGGSRRGAAMFMLDDWHPDVLRFIDAKRDESRITNANVSVAVSDEFMRRVEEDLVWNFHFPDTSHPAYDAEWDGDLSKWLERHGGESVKPYGSIRAREMWRKLAEAAHASGEPGVVFLDRYNKLSTGQGVERLICVNPCGEQGLGPYSVCNLGAMNLGKYVRGDTPGDDGPRFFDYAAFGRDVQTAVKFLDRVIDVNYYFLPENEKVQKELRRIGLGVMGLADALILLGIRYGSPEAVAFTEEVFAKLKQNAVMASANLAAQYGPAPAWRGNMLDRPYFADLPVWVKDHVTEAGGLRNLFLTTQAPTGTTSTLAGASSGIEPLFDLGYWRNDRTGEHWVEPPVLAKAVPAGMPKPDFVVTANEVTVEEHIAMQAAAQKYIDSSISKTINAPNDQSVDEVEKAYTLAYESGLKGLTYYRDGSRQEQVLSREQKAPTAAEVEDARQQAREWEAVAKEYERQLDEHAKLTPFIRRSVLSGRTHKVRAGMQTAYVTVNRDEKRKPVEVFVSVGKSGTGMMEMGEAIGRLASIGLQKGLTIDDLIDQLDGVGNNGMLNMSLPSAIAAALKADKAEEDKTVTTTLHIAEGKVAPESSWGPETGEWQTVDITDLVESWRPKNPSPEFKTGGGDLCPACGEMSLVRQEGCAKCMSCDHSAC